MSPVKTPSGGHSTQRRSAAPTTSSVRQRALQQQQQLQQQKKVHQQQQQFEEHLIDLSHLSAAEREQILGVLEREAAVRKQEQARVL
jgi:hypothetical protein